MASPPPPQALSSRPEASAPAPPPGSGGALARIGRVLPHVQGAVRLTRRVALASALAALPLWWVLAGEAALDGRLNGAVAAALALMLLVPAGATWLLGRTLGDLLALPSRLRASAAAAASGLSGGGRRGRGGLFALVQAVWAARSLAAGPRAWAGALAAGRLVRVASVPALVGLAALSALSVALVPAGALALGWLVLRALG